jgi:hypothetical protein
MCKNNKIVSKDARNKMRLAIQLLLFSGVFILTSCNYKAVKILAKPGADFLMKVKSEACLGTCPVYNMQLNAERELSFRGGINCAFQGDTALYIKEEDYQNLKSNLLANGFFAMDSVYDDPDFMDGINYSIEVSDPESKYASHRVRTRTGAPEGFKVIKRQIGIILRSYGLLKYDPSAKGYRGF